MGTVTVGVKVKTDATISVSVDTLTIPLDGNGEGAFTISVGDERLLSWVVVGDPGQKYEIALQPPASYKVEAVTGTHPVKSRISTRLFRGAGHLRFKIVAR